jgi:hypothetical protein
MSRARVFSTFPLLCVLPLAAPACSKKDGPPPAPSSNASPGHPVILADTGFRPEKNGFKFENQGGAYPRTPPVLTASDVSKMFGGSACASGSSPNCKLSPVATEWMGMVNRAMNGGQCEGMAVSSQAFYQGLYKPQSYSKSAKSIHDLTHAETAPLIGYYWAYQMVNPVRADKAASLQSMTPVTAEDTLIDMMKKKELAVIAIRSSEGGHAITPYQVVDRGGGIHWIEIYDNNWPDKERHIIIDRNANTWAYELASLNPDVPKEPWTGDASTHTIAVTPLSDRLSSAECPFCTGGKQMVSSSGTNGVTLTNSSGKRVGRDGDKIVNEIPGAEVVQIASFLPGVSSNEPLYIVPPGDDYQIAIAGRDKPSRPDQPDDDHGVSVIGDGRAVNVATPKLKPSENATLTVAHDGGVKYKTAAQGGQFPPIRLAADGPRGGMHAQLTNMKADANDEIGIKLDHTSQQVEVSGGGKKATAFDLKVTHVQPDGEDKVAEQKGIKFQPGMTNTIHAPLPAAGAPPGGSPFKVTKSPTPPPAKFTPVPWHEPPHTAPGAHGEPPPVEPAHVEPPHGEPPPPAGKPAVVTPPTPPGKPAPAPPKGPPPPAPKKH